MFRPARMSLLTVIYPVKYEDRVIYELMSSKCFQPEKPKTTVSTSPEEAAKIKERLSRASEAYDKLNGIVQSFNLEAMPLFGRISLEIRRRSLTGRNWSELLDLVYERAVEYERYTQEITGKMRELNERIEYLRSLRESLRIVERYNINLEGVNVPGEQLYMILGVGQSESIREASTAFNTLNALVEEFPLDERKSLVLVVVRSKYASEADKVAQVYGIAKVQVPQTYPQEVREAVKAIEEDIKRLTGERRELEVSLRKYLDSNRGEILALRDAAAILKDYYETLTYTHRVERFAQISGYMPHGRVEGVRRAVEKASNGTAVTVVEEAEEAPTYIEYPRFLEPIVEVLKLYGLPEYKEVSPVLLMAISFPIIYGLMYADLGHGLTLLILGLLAYKYFNSPSFKTLGLLGAYFGAASTVTGFFTGEVFGAATPMAKWLKGILHEMGFEHPPLGIEFEEAGSGEIVMTLLLFSIKIGIVHMLVGFILGIINAWNEGEKIEALTMLLPQTLVFVIGTAPFLFAYKTETGTVLPWLTSGGQISPDPTWLYSLLGLILFLAVGKPIVDRIARVEEPMGFGMAIFEAFDYILRLVSNTASYMRITALLVAHAGLVYAFYKLGMLVGGSEGIVGTVLFWIIYALGNVLTIALEAIIVFVQAARLHFYEWFSKFYRGTGVEFQPLKTSTAYVEVGVATG